MQVQGLSNTSLALEHQAKIEYWTQREHAQREGDNIQSIKHRTQIMKEKYLCILAYEYETDYNGSISQTKDVAYQSHPQKN